MKTWKVPRTSNRYLAHIGETHSTCTNVRPRAKAIEKVKTRKSAQSVMLCLTSSRQVAGLAKCCSHTLPFHRGPNLISCGRVMHLCMQENPLWSVILETTLSHCSPHVTSPHHFMSPCIICKVPWTSLICVSNLKCVYMCVTKCVYMCVTKCVNMCVTKCVNMCHQMRSHVSRIRNGARFARLPLLASLARFF